MINAIIILAINQKKVVNKMDKVRTLLDEMFHGFNSIIKGIKELKINRVKLSNLVEEKITHTTKVYQDEMSQVMAFYALLQSWWKCGFLLLIGFFIFIFPIWYSDLSDGVIRIVLTLLMLISPLTTLLNFLPAYQKAIISFAKIKILYHQDTEISPALPVEIFSECQQICLNGISFSYFIENHKKPIIQGLSAVFNAGEINFITGKNGCGKSTLIKLLSGLYFPQTGTITLNNIAVNQYNLLWYRNHFSIIFSDFHLFDKIYGVDCKAKTDQINFWLEKFQLKEVISINHGKFSTLNLSSGQKKRLALLIAFLEDKPIYILDEWASEQDPFFKHLFYNELIFELKRKHKCVIIVSHDDHYYHLADKLFVLNDGQLLKQEEYQILFQQ